MKAKFAIVNLPELKATTALYEKATGRDSEFILNKLSVNSLYKSIRHTPKASVSSITADLGTAQNPKQLAFNLASKALAGRGTVQDIYELAVRIINARRRSVAYIKAGWVVALRVFGVHSRLQLSNKNLASKRGSAKKATSSRWKTTFFNGAPGSGQVGFAALQKGMQEALSDSRNWATSKLQRTASRFSHR